MSSIVFLLLRIAVGPIEKTAPRVFSACEQANDSEVHLLNQFETAITAGADPIHPGLIRDV